jgi:hypothetical protein
MAAREHPTEHLSDGHIERAKRGRFRGTGIVRDFRRGACDLAGGQLPLHVP